MVTFPAHPDIVRTFPLLPASFPTPFPSPLQPLFLKVGEAMPQAQPPLPLQSEGQMSGGPTQMWGKGGEASQQWVKENVSSQEEGGGRRCP